MGDYDEVLDAQFLGSSTTQVVLATNSDDLQIVDRTTQNNVALAGHSEVILAVAVNTAGNLIASASKVFFLA